LIGVMEAERKNLLLAGVCLGDVTLALAAVAEALPPYVEGLEVERLLEACDDRDAVSAEVEKHLASGQDMAGLPKDLLRTILERAVGRGKFLSAIRCLEMLEEREAYVERCLDKARKAAESGRMEDAARNFVVAANLDLPDGIPPFQYTGPELHDACSANPENCVTRMERENAILRAFRYLLPSDRIHEAVSSLSPGQREDLLCFVARERDPRISDFLKAFEQARNHLAETEEKALAGLKSRAEKVEGAVRKFADSLGGISTAEEGEKEVLDRLRRTAGGLTKELAGLGDLVRDRQFRRLARRMEQLVESRGEIEKASETLGSRGGAGGTVFDPMLGLIGEIEEDKVLDKIKNIEERLLSAQVTMLGREVHSHEHWQYLRELAFKYPVSPLVCCIARINDRWMVVPVWESPVYTILRAGPNGKAKTVNQTPASSGEDS